MNKADCEVVAAHESEFMKQAGVDMKVWEATLEDLAAIDIGSWFDAAYACERTPTLRDILLSPKAREKVIIELKYYGRDVELEARVVRIVEQTDMAGDIAVMSLKIPGVQEMQKLRPDWTYGVLAIGLRLELAALAASPQSKRPRNGGLLGR